ncbi:MAG: electron transport complex subunit RsxC [Elusimicrobia bacterium]|nr:electron transport complex subunit RsxC [Elusimicrobiota bacterium]
MLRGIKIHSYKESTRHEKIEGLPFPEKVTLYASQHIGAHSRIIVKKNEQVRRGQAVAQPQGRCSSYLHASIGGKVQDITVLPRPDGLVCEAVVIAREGDQAIQLMEPVKDITPESIRSRVSEAGIVGMGGAGFPASVKLDPPKPVQTAFLNACECEPYLTADERLLIEDAKKVVEGFRLVKKAVGAEKGIIGIEDDKKHAIGVLRQVTGSSGDIELSVLPKVYPQGYEKMLITAVTGKEVPSGGLPHDVGVSVHNVGTCLAVYEAVNEGKPLIERVLTLAGPQLIDSVNIRVSIGTGIREIIDYYQVIRTASSRILIGGPMMGFAVDDIDSAVMKTTSGILVDNAGKTVEHPCSGCGKCVDVCPMGLVPQRLNRFYDGKDYAGMKSEGLLDCMECGCCAYICPCGVPLTYKFKAGKRKL